MFFCYTNYPRFKTSVSLPPEFGQRRERREKKNKQGKEPFNLNNFYCSDNVNAHSTIFDRQSFTFSFQQVAYKTRFCGIRQNYRSHSDVSHVRYSTVFHSFLFHISYLLNITSKNMFLNEIDKSLSRLGYDNLLVCTDLHNGKFSTV